MPPRRKKDPPSFKPSAETLKNFQMPEETPQLELASDDAGTYATPSYAFKWPTLTDPEGVRGPASIR